jgi:hypothetical protein
VRIKDLIVWGVAIPLAIYGWWKLASFIGIALTLGVIAAILVIGLTLSCLD